MATTNKSLTHHHHHEQGKIVIRNAGPVCDMIANTSNSVEAANRNLRRLVLVYLMIIVFLNMF